MITKDEFVQWKTDKVTQAFFSALNEKIEDVKEILLNSAGKDSDSDSFFRGYGFAYREIFDIRVDEGEES